MPKNRIKLANHDTFVNHFSLAPPVETAHSSVKILPVGGHPRNFWEIWASKRVQGSTSGSTFFKFKALPSDLFTAPMEW